MAFPPDVSAFVNADGTVTVPARVADKMLRLVTLGVLDARRRHILIDLDMILVLDAMNIATLAAGRASSAVGTDDGEDRRLGDAATLRPVAEVADAMGCSTRWVRKEIASGHLLAHRVGSRWLIADSDFETYRHAQRRTAR
jgi:excisionase family DNA binding protein